MPVRGTDKILHLPANEIKHASQCLVLLHEPSDFWDYPSLTGYEVIITKWSELELVLEGHTFHLVDERDVLAVIGDIDPL